MIEELEFRGILKDSGMSQKEFGESVKMSHSGVRNGLSRGTKKGPPLWLRTFLLGFRLGKGSEKNRTPEAL